MSEALELLFTHASALGVTCLTADIDADNVRSIALFEKLGFKTHAPLYLTRDQMRNPLVSQTVMARLRHKKTGTQGFRFFLFQPRLANQQIKPGF